MIPACIGRIKARLSLVVPGRGAASPDPSLIALVAEARDWFARASRREAPSLAAIAREDGVAKTSVQSGIGAAFLAPDLVTAIVEGRQPARMSVATLRSMLPLPTNWVEQRALFAALG